MQASVLDLDPGTIMSRAPAIVADSFAQIGCATADIQPALGALLDELDYGMMLLRDGARVVYVNHAARQFLREGSCIALVDGALRARCEIDTQALADALAAARRGLRRLVILGAERTRASVAFVPMGVPLPGRATLIAAVIGRRRLCESMSVQWFARDHSLTPTETRVLEMLCNGLDPGDIATLSDVSLATVRTQVKSIRDKIGVASIRALLQRLATLPPMVSALRC